MNDHDWKNAVEYMVRKTEVNKGGKHHAISSILDPFNVKAFTTIITITSYWCQLTLYISWEIIHLFITFQMVVALCLPRILFILTVWLWSENLISNPRVAPWNTIDKSMVVIWTTLQTTGTIQTFFIQFEFPGAVSLRKCKSSPWCPARLKYMKGAQDPVTSIGGYD